MCPEPQAAASNATVSQVCRREQKSPRGVPSLEETTSHSTANFLAQAHSIWERSRINMYPRGGR